MPKVRPFRNYASQVRMFALLLILFLTLLLINATYLYSRAIEQLALDLEGQLQRVAEMASEGLGAAQPAQVPSAIRKILRETRTSRIFLWGSSGSEVIFGAGPPAQPPISAIDEARAGSTRFTDFYGERGQGYYRALLRPLPEGPGGERRVLGVEARADFLGFLHRIRSVILAAYAGGLILALVVCAVFIRSILRPYEKLTTVARDFRQAEGRAAEEGGQDIDFVVSTFQQAAETLREKEAELTHLHAAERTRAVTLEQHQHILLGSISSAVLSFKPDLTIAVCNERAQRIFGFDGEEVIGRPCEEVFGGNSEITVTARKAMDQQRVFSRLELSVRRKDGVLRHVGLSSSILKDSEGRLIGLALLMTDLTDIIQFREQAVLRESLAALGRMSAGIAHEFRNSLGVIMGYAKLLQQNIAAGSSNHAYIQEIVSEIGHLEATIRDILAFARPVQLSPEPVEIKALVTETLDGFRQIMEGEKTRMLVELPGEDVSLQADPYALRQALANIIRNALEAMPDGGELAVTVRPEGVEPGAAAGRGARLVEISVQDTGPGVPPEIIDRIFTPFFTEKEGGTGLGLALVQKTVLAHGGRVGVRNREGGGACFTIHLPWNERRRAPRW